MRQHVSVITLGVADLSRSCAFYRDGFGWTPVFENPQIAFYQMNGLVLGTFLKRALDKDMQREAISGPGAYALAHDVSDKAEVDVVMAQLVRGGGRLLRPADAPPHGGYRGYVADPDGHPWEIA